MDLRGAEKKALMELRKKIKGLLGDRLSGFILFGSRARGDYNKESDIDLAIIVRGLSRELKKEILDEVAETEFNHLTPLSVFVISKDDFDRLKKRERRIALDIEREGIPF